MKHNLSYHKLYPTWNAMMNRCHNKNDKGYKYYGQRGIKVNKRWHDIKNFIDDMFPSYKEGLTLDRINNNKGYSANNCRWITLKENANNTRSNRIIKYNGEEKTVTQLAEENGIKPATLWARLFIYNFPLEKALQNKNFNYEKRKYFPKPCTFCDEEFLPRNDTYKFCSKSCATKSRYHKK